MPFLSPGRNLQQQDTSAGFRYLSSLPLLFPFPPSLCFLPSPSPFHSFSLSLSLVLPDPSLVRLLAPPPLPLPPSSFPPFAFYVSLPLSTLFCLCLFLLSQLSSASVQPIVLFIGPVCCFCKSCLQKQLFYKKFFSKTSLSQKLLPPGLFSQHVFLLFSCLLLSTSPP